MPQLRVHPGLLRPLMADSKPVSILVLFDRKNSAIEDLARFAAMGVELAGGIVNLKRTTKATQAEIGSASCRERV